MKSLRSPVAAPRVSGPRRAVSLEREPRRVSSVRICREDPESRRPILSPQSEPSHQRPEFTKARGAE